MERVYLCHIENKHKCYTQYTCKEFASFIEADRYHNINPVFPSTIKSIPFFYPRILDKYILDRVIRKMFFKVEISS
jgi:hypothetical protein